MESSEEESDNELFMCQSLSKPDDIPVPGKSQLKPKLDSIFAEVEKNLPSIDFDISDVSDTEEQGIFQRSLKITTFDDDKDLDTSLSGESLSDLLPPIVDSLSVSSSTDDASCQTLFDNDSAAKKSEQKSKLVTKSTSTSWTEAVIEAREDKTRFTERPHGVKLQNWVETDKESDVNLSNAMAMMEAELGIQREESFSSNGSENVEKHENESTSESPGKSSGHSGPAHYSTGDKRMDRMVMKEERRRHEENIVSNIVSPTAPKLLTSIGNLNIDLILNSLNEDGQSVPPAVRVAWAQQQQQQQQEVSASQVELRFAAGEGCNRLTEEKNNENNRQQTLIQRLAELSTQQWGEDLSTIDPVTGASKYTIPDEDADINTVEGNRSSSPLFIRRGVPMTEKFRGATETKEEKVLGEFFPEDKEPAAQKTTSSCGTNTSDLQPLRVITPTPRPKTDQVPETKKEPDTVFIDLRNFDQKCKEQQQSIERVQRVLRLQQDSSSSDNSDSEHETESWFEQRRRIKQGLASKGSSTETLASKPKPRWSGPVRHPQRVIDLSEYDNRLASRAQGAGEPDSDIDEAQAAILAEKKKAEEEEKEKQRKAELARKQREEREAERQARLRLAKRLDALRPTASVSGKQDCAESTPVLYDLEASYEPAPKSLPSVLPTEQEVLLLTIHLSSNGEIILHRGKTNKSVDTGVGLSASYTVLLSWLLSLVPENYGFLQTKGDGKKGDNFSLFDPLFYVLGLEQLWMDEHLYLFVTITPSEQFDARQIQGKVKKSKLKDEVKDSSPFQQMVTKFLSTNTLHSVCPWLQDMVSVEVPCPTGNSDSTPGYIYRPPLPNITTKPLSTFVQINPDPNAAQKVFNTTTGFFWQTVDNDESSFEQILNDSEVHYDTQITMSLVYKKIFHDPRAMMGIFNRILQEGLDLAGVRLVYPNAELLNNASGKPNVPNETVCDQSDTELLNKIGPVLAIGLRGTFARSIWLDAIGPSDPVLARRTDPNSLCALYGGSSREECLLFCPRNPSRVQAELSRWFGGRVQPGGVMDVGTPYTRKDNVQGAGQKGRKAKKLSFVDADDEKTMAVQHRPPAALSATTKSDIFLVLSPHVPPKCVGIIMATCQRRGYQIRGVRRSRLTTKKASCLGIDSGLFSTFCPGTPSSSVEQSVSQSKHTEAVSPCSMLLLEKENAAHSAASLIEACMMQLTLQGIMGSIQKSADHNLLSKHLFHAARYSDTLLTNLGGDFTKCIDHEIQVNHSFVVPKLYTNPEVEQIVIALLLGHDILKSCGLFIGKLLNMVPYSRSPPVLPLKEGFELLGIKWVASLSTSQAKEVTPYEVGDRLWKENIHVLCTEPAVVLALRGVDAFNKLQGVIPSVQLGQSKTGHIDYLMSMNAEEAYSFARAFFTEKELFQDPQARTLLPYLPQSRYHIHGQEHRPQASRTNVQHEAIFEIMQSGPQPVTTVLVIKPRAVAKHFPKILRKINQEGFQVVAMRLLLIKPEEATTLIDDKGNLSNERIEEHVQYLTSGPCVYLVLQRENAIKKLLELLGPADPVNARRQSQFLWRGTFGVDPIKNGLHASTSYLDAIEEQKLFFPHGLCCAETEDLREEKIPCPAVDEVIDMCYHSNRDVIIHDISDGPQEILESHLLLQTTCIVLKPTLLQIHDRGDYAYVEVVEGLVKHGFDIVGSRMIWFTKEQAEVFLHVINAGSFKQIPLFLSGPCIVLALQRDNAVIAFDSILGSDYGSESLIGKYGDHISRPVDVSQAHKMLTFFFDNLIPGCQVEIVPK